MGLDLSNKVLAVVGAILGVIISLLIIGNSSMITQINSAFTGICNSGWPLATLFNSSSGIAPLLLVVGVFIATISGTLAIGKSFSGKK